MQPVTAVEVGAHAARIRGIAQGAVDPHFKSYFIANAAPAR